MSLAPGTRLGPYEVTGQIGAGGMGEVYRATDTNLKRQVAIKVLPEAVATDSERLARFQREAEVLASLNHPNIAAIHGLERADGQTALVMELVEGPTLADRIAQGPIPLEEALPIARQIAEALEAAHEQGIIHRDLKPANIKVRGDGTVKVLDFGLAKALEPSVVTAAGVSLSPTITSPAMTMAGVILGTAAYMSPEQARGKVVDKRADIWAFGCVLYEMLTGQGAFGGEDVTVTLARVVEREPNLDALPPAVPARVRQVLGLCLRKDPKQRVSDIRDVRLALDGAFDSSVAQAVTAPPARGTRPREYVPWMLAAVATLSALGAVALYLRAPRAQDAIVRFNVLPPQGTVRRPFMHSAASPDGQFLAFVARGADGVTRVLTKRIDTAEAQVLSGTDRVGAFGSVFWAPDSRSLGFSRDGAVFSIKLDGSPPRRLCDVPGNIFTGGSWAPGVIVFGGANGLVRVPETGGTPTPVTALDAGAKEERHVGPWFLPDGRHLLFLALAPGQTRGVVWAASLDDPARTRITESFGAIAYAEDWLLSTTETPRRLVAQRFDAKRLSLQGSPQPVGDRLPGPNTGGYRGFAVSSNGVLVVDRPSSFTSRIEWVDRTGRVESVLGPSGPIASFAIAPDDRRVVAQVLDRDAGRTDLWLFEPGRADGTRLTHDGSASRPLWSRDNRHVHFTRLGETGFRLLTIAVGETAATPFENPGPFVHFEDATRDGQYLVFKSLSNPTEIWMQRVGSKEQRALVQSPFSATRPRVSPDSRWLAYTLDQPSGTEVFAQPFNRAGDRIQVSRGGGIGPIWRDDSRELYYEGPDGLMAVEMTDRDGTLAAATPQRLFALHTQGNTVNQPHNVEVAAHGQKFLVNSIVGDSDNVPLEVTLNWTSGLK